MIWTRTNVTPFTGVWIEIAAGLYISNKPTVTPFTGVWIEILFLYLGKYIHGS